MRGFLIVILLFWHASGAAQAAGGLIWQPHQAENLAYWIDRAGDAAIVLPADEAKTLRASIDSGDRARLDRTATRSAFLLMRAYHGLCCGPARPRNWHIDDPADENVWRLGLAEALAEDRTDLFFRSLQPQHPYYRQLAAAYAQAEDPVQRQLLAINLARWRWMPRSLGSRYLLVNAAAQEVSLWNNSGRVGNWLVIVGKRASPTPVFSAQVTGAVINPWWEIPSSIAAEGIGAFVRRNPAGAKARGYIYQGGRYRQMPGDNNALGRMKLVMPNSYSVFLHDTSNRELFDRPERTLSHGCVRVDQALQFAAALLETDGWSLADLEQIAAAGKTVTLPLKQAIPVYSAYFTAEPDRSGAIQFWPDIYHRDNIASPAIATAATGCAVG